MLKKCCFVSPEAFLGAPEAPWRLVEISQDVANHPPSKFTANALPNVLLGAILRGFRSHKEFQKCGFGDASGIQVDIARDAASL